MSLLANEFHVRSVLQGQWSLSAVNQSCVIHEAMNGGRNLKIHLMKARGGGLRYILQNKSGLRL